MQKGKVNITDVNIKLKLCNNVFALVNKKEEETTLLVHMLTFLCKMQSVLFPLKRLWFILSCESFEALLFTITGNTDNLHS